MLHFHGMIKKRKNCNHRDKSLHTFYNRPLIQHYIHVINVVFGARDPCDLHDLQPRAMGHVRGHE